MSERFTYRYYILGNVTPVRVAFDEYGRKAGAQAIDRESGALTWQNTYLSRLEMSYEVEEIDEEEFTRLCRDIPGRTER